MAASCRRCRRFASSVAPLSALHNSAETSSSSFERVGNAYRSRNSTFSKSFNHSSCRFRTMAAAFCFSSSFSSGSGGKFTSTFILGHANRNALFVPKLATAFVSTVPAHSIIVRPIPTRLVIIFWLLTVSGFLPLSPHT